MRKMKSFFTIMMATILLLSGLSIMPSAYSESKSVKILNFNVAGLPKFDGTDVGANQTVIADYINNNNFDIVATQEDFGYHYKLSGALNGYTYKTNHSGSIPGGDGLNIFTQSMPIYNETRVQWNDSFGDIAEGDTLTPKGILHSVIQIDDGIYIDFYDIHADAFDGEGSIAARKSNFTQVAEMINSNYEKYRRPVIITGDFNTYLHTPNHDQNSNMYEIFVEQCGLTDAWIELHNNNDYSNFGKWYETGISYWGEWDSVEKFMYKDGENIDLQATDFKYTWIKNADGNSVSDHAAAECTITFTKTGENVSGAQDLEIIENDPMRNIINTIRWIIKDLIYILSNINELIEMLS